MIETTQLQTLVSVANAQSFSKAAGILGVTQSAISQSIKNLERKVAVKLFKRAGKQVVLTAEGEKLYKLASHFLVDLEDVIDELEKDKTSVSGTVRMGTLFGMGKAWLAPRLLCFADEFPDLCLSVVMGFQENLIRDFENNRLDFLLLPEEALPGVGQKILLGEEKLVLVYPKSEKFEVGSNITFDELTSLPTILFQKEDHLFMKWCQTYFDKAPRKINSRFIINSHGNMLQAVTQGLGIAVVPKHVLDRSYYKEKVNIFDGKKFVSNGKFYLVFHKESKDLKRINQVMEKLVHDQSTFE